MYHIFLWLSVRRCVEIWVEDWKIGTGWLKIGTKVRSIMQGSRNGTNHIRGRQIDRERKLNSKEHDKSIRHTYFQIHVYTKEYHTITFSINEQWDIRKREKIQFYISHRPTPYIISSLLILFPCKQIIEMIQKTSYKNFHFGLPWTILHLCVCCCCLLSISLL